MAIHILYFTTETCPTFRVDLCVLFGKYLPLYGIYSDIVAGKTPSKDEDLVIWGGGENYLCDIAGGSVKKNIKIFIHSIKHLFKADANKYQAIQVRDMPVFAAIALLISKFKQVKFIYWMSFPMPEDSILRAHQRGLSEGFIKFFFPWLNGHIGYFLLYRLVLSKADHVFVQSEQMKANLTKYGVCPDKMTPVPMGVDIEALQDHDVRPVCDKRLVGRRSLVYLGTCGRSRKIEILFEMLLIVKHKFPTVLLLMVGDDLHDEVQRRFLKRKAKEIGISDNIIWTGWLPRCQAWSYVRSSEIGLSPFPRSYLLDSASPTKVPEYLVMGVPVICNDNPDQEQIIRQSGAGLCVPYLAEDFASAVIKMLSLDKLELHEMARKGNDYVSQFRDYRHISFDVAGSYKKLLIE